MINNSEYKPLASRVILKLIPDSEEERTIGSIILAESAIPVEKATVVSVGRGEIAMNTGELIEMEVSVGQTVLIRKGIAHLPLKISGEDCMLVREGDIECIVG